MDTSTERDDLRDALDFLTRRLDDWHQRGLLTAPQHQDLTRYYDDLRRRADGEIPTHFQLLSPQQCWSCRESVGEGEPYCEECGAPAHTAGTRSFRYLRLLCHEIRKHEKA